MAFEELYQEIIRDHFKNPRARSVLGPEVPVYENPSCGDTVKLKVERDAEGRLDVRFDGSGCSISMSSTSILCDLVKGLNAEEARQRVELFLQAMRGEAPADVLDDLGDAVALKGVIVLPVRVKCATLAWNALKQALGA